MVNVQHLMLDAKRRERITDGIEAQGPRSVASPSVSRAWRRRSNLRVVVDAGLRSVRVRGIRLGQSSQWLSPDVCSVPGEGGFALLEERGDALFVVLRIAAERLAYSLGFEGGGEVALEASVQGLLDPSQSARR